jgi:hypothetical protein
MEAPMSDKTLDAAIHRFCTDVRLVLAEVNDKPYDYASGDGNIRDTLCRTLGPDHALDLAALGTVIGWVLFLCEHRAAYRSLTDRESAARTAARKLYDAFEFATQHLGDNHESIQ